MVCFIASWGTLIFACPFMNQMGFQNHVTGEGTIEQIHVGAKRINLWVFHMHASKFSFCYGIALWLNMLRYKDKHYIILYLLCFYIGNPTMYCALLFKFKMKNSGLRYMVHPNQMSQFEIRCYSNHIVINIAILMATKDIFYLYGDWWPLQTYLT